MENKRIVFITPTMGGGGAERVMATLANKLAERGFFVTIAVTRSEGCIYDLNQGVLLEENKHSYSAISQIRYIRSILKKYQGAVFISFLTYQNMYTLLAGMGLKQRIIVSERNDPSTMLDGRNYLEVLRTILYMKAERIVFQTKDARAYFNKKIRRRGVIIPNPVREDLPESYHGAREKRFVAYCRLDRQKNIPMMLEAFAKFCRKYPEYELSIYGKGEEEQALIQMAREMGMEKNVQFCGFAENVHEKIKKAAAFLSSSDYEGISNSMLEAMAIGLPCICTDCPIGGTRMFIKDGYNGMLVKVGDAAEMAEKMCRVAGEEALAERLSKNAVSIKKKLAPDRIVDEWLKILYPEKERKQ